MREKKTINLIKLSISKKPYWISQPAIAVNHWRVKGYSVICADFTQGEGRLWAIIIFRNMGPELSYPCNDVTVRLIYDSYTAFTTLPRTTHKGVRLPLPILFSNSISHSAFSSGNYWHVISVVPLTLFKAHTHIHTTLYSLYVLQIWRTAANMLNKRSRTADKGGFVVWGMVVGSQT
jgi:hypothetical protein